MLVDSVNCPACLKEYHTMEKLKAHLYYARNCRLTLLSRNYACQSVPGAGSPDSYTTFTSGRATPTTTTSW